MAEVGHEVRGPLVVIVGPTAVGKTSLAVELAEALGGVIVSADSRQVYRGMDIGTAKPTIEEQSRASHALIDVLDPAQRLSLAQYQDMAYEAIDAALEADRLPLLVGGTGQYVQAVVEGWRIPRVLPDPLLRLDLTGFAITYGAGALHNRLRQIDPDAAKSIDHRNVRRVARALEVYELSGERISDLQRKQMPPYDVLMIGLWRPREALYERIDQRIDVMLSEGLVDEVRRLLNDGLQWDYSALGSLGYRQLRGYFEGDESLEDATRAIKKETRRFVRQQDTWFRQDDPRITWFNLEQQGADEVIAFVRMQLMEAGWFTDRTSQ